MVVSGINNYKTPSFGARTRSEREAEKERAQERLYYTVATEDEIRQLKEIRRNRKAKQEQKVKEEFEQDKFRKEEKQYRQDVKDLRETQQIIHDITDSGRDKNIFSGGTLKKLGTATDILITGTLSGMALHWSTGKAFMMLHSCAKKPKIAKILSNIKKPFSIVNNAVQKGASTAWSTMKKEVKATKQGREFLASKPMQALNRGLTRVNSSYKNLKADIHNLTVQDVKSGISTIFGVSGFAAGVVEKVAPLPKEKDK